VLEAMQRGIEGTLLDAQQIVGNLLNALRDCPTVQRLERDRPHDQEIEGALQDVGLIAHAACLL
jgi:hypothetical protein